MTTVESSWTELKHPRLPEFTENYLLKLAAECPTLEVCGLIAANGTVLPITNIDDNPRYGFKMDRDELVKALNAWKITGVYHSHPSGDRLPSNLDTRQMSYLYQQGCPWDYYIVADGAVYLYEHRDRTS